MIKIEQQGREITVKVNGREFSLLERVAKAMNRPEWTDNDNTALTVFRDWVWPWLDDYFETPKEFVGSILAGIDTYRKGVEHERRLAELEAAFRKAGLLRERDGV